MGADPGGVATASLQRLGDLSAYPATRDSLWLLAHPDSLEIEPEPSFHDPGFDWSAPPTVAPPCSPARLLAQFERGWGTGADDTTHRWLAFVWPGNLDP